LLKDGLLAAHDIEHAPHQNPHKIDFGPAITYKYDLLQKAFHNFKAKRETFKKEFDSFCKKNHYWLDDYSLFMASKQFHGGISWTEWDKSIAFRKELSEWKKKLHDEIEYHNFLQFEFDKQWTNIRTFAHENGIKIIGDLPIFIAYDSADLWANKELFSVGKDGRLEFVAGVPPDYFSATGQLWGNPLYRWKVMEKDNFKWWKSRIAKLLQMVDIIRIDHFRGFDAYWEIPGNAETAIKGRWVKAPGEKLFNAIKNELGDVPIIAEDLGVITDSVEELRDKFEFPGIKIIQFGLGKDGEKKFLPHNHIKNCVVHTGSHDNETTRGFLETERKKHSGIYEWTQKYFNYHGDNMTFELIRAVYASVANIAVIPMQDMLNLDNSARMNLPGSLGGNWAWRFTWNQVDESLAAQYKEMTIIYERPPLKKNENAVIEVEED
jgi:4-alpha-glucanotransferase